MIAALKPAAGRRRMLVRLFHAAAPGSATVSLDMLFETVDAVVDPRAERPDMIDLGAWEREGLLAKLDTLPERQAAVIRLRFGLGGAGAPLTLREIGRQLDLSRERVRQLEHEALATLRIAIDGPSAKSSKSSSGKASAPAAPVISAPAAPKKRPAKRPTKRAP